MCGSAMDSGVQIDDGGMMDDRIVGALGCWVGCEIFLLGWGGRGDEVQPDVNVRGQMLFYGFR